MMVQPTSGRSARVSKYSTLSDGMHMWASFTAAPMFAASPTTAPDPTKTGAHRLGTPTPSRTTAAETNTDAPPSASRVIPRAKVELGTLNRQARHNDRYLIIGVGVIDQGTFRRTAVALTTDPVSEVLGILDRFISGRTNGDQLTPQRIGVMVAQRPAAEGVARSVRARREHQRRRSDQHHRSKIAADHSQGERQTRKETFH